MYQSQRAIMKQKHQEKEQYISMLAQDKEEMKVGAFMPVELLIVYALFSFYSICSFSSSK